MRIALARRGYSATGGAETYLRRFAAGALAAGHECILYATEEWPEASWPGKIVRLPQASGPGAFAERLLAARANCDADIFFSLERVLACDVYRAGDGLHAAWLERRTHFEPGWRGWFRRWNRKHAEVLKLERTLFLERGARQVIANSRMVKREIEHHFPNFPAESIHVVYNGAPQPELSTAVRTQVRRNLGLEPADYALLFAGSGWDRKGLRFAIEAVNACSSPEARLFVAGKGRAESMPRSNCTRFLGARDDMPSLLAAADAFILPTIYDPFSNACLEAMNAGLPVITTTANGFAELLEPGADGEVIEAPNDVTALREAIDRWAPVNRPDSVRARLRAKAAKFSVERNLRETLAVLELAVR
jgi:UDP-glucose:(heptosyl)LPS alpha-1,3-glucosyltransferase